MNNRSVLHSILDSKPFWVAVSLLISVLLWLYVTGTEGVVVEREFDNVRVELLGEEEMREASGLVVTDQSCTSVNLVLSGLRRDIGKLTSANLSVRVDLRDVRTDGNFTKLFEIQYPTSVKSDDITYVGASADSITLTVDRLVTQYVEVKGDFTGTTAPGYLAEDSLSFDPLTVKISGPRAAVEAVDCAYVLITRENVDSTLSYRTTYTLQDAEGNPVDTSNLTMDTEEINVTLSVLMTKTVALTVSLIPGGGATGEGDVDVRVTPDSIVLAGDPDTLEAVNQIVVDTVRLANVNALYEVGGLMITIPNDTENISGVTSAAVRLEIVNLASSYFTVPREAMVCTNVPESLEAEVITENLQILVRGSEADISKIEAKNLRVVADLAEIAENSGIYNVTVKISVDGYPNAGAVGEYKVYVRLAAQEDQS